MSAFISGSKGLKQSRLSPVVFISPSMAKAQPIPSSTITDALYIKLYVPIILSLSKIGKKIDFCIGCLSCQLTQECVIKDDANEIAEKVKNADVIVYATPVYYYEMSGQMKTLIDRMNCLFPSDYKFRDVYLLAASAEDEESAMDGAIKGVQGWVDCFEKANLAGVIRGTGLTETGEAKKDEEILKKAYEMGKSV